MEQSYKVDEWDIQESDIPDLLDDEFISAVTKRFHAMHKDFQETLNRH